jgi:antitoxin PrlF
MPHLHEVATLTSKGQVTLPKAVRQALRLDTGSKVAFDLLGSQVVVSRVETDVHEDPAIGGFLGLLAQDIQNGRHIGTLPADLVESMLARLHEAVDLDAEISGDVDL